MPAARISLAVGAWSRVAVEGNPAIGDPSLVPHMKREPLVGRGVDQADTDASWNLAGAAQGGQQHGVFGTVAFERLRHVGGGGESLAEVFFLDAVVDPPPDSGTSEITGINLHRAREGGASTVVDKWSAGCQVYASSIDLDIALDRGRAYVPIHGPRFDYRLLLESQVAEALTTE